MPSSIRKLITKAQSHNFARPAPTGDSQERQLWSIGHRNKNNQKKHIFLRGDSNNEGQERFGTIYFPNGQVFEGYLQGIKPTNGVFVFNEECFYVGEFKGLWAEGRGRFQSPGNGYVYEGEWKNNLAHGQGIEQFRNGDRFQGSFMCGAKFSYGVYNFADGRKYEGNFYNNFSDGSGKLTFPNGNFYEGQWKLGRMDGKGIYKWKNGDSYEGQYKQGLRQGHGKYRFNDGSFYEGGWARGHQEGQGVIREGFDEVRGIWQAGQRVE